jgi:hypothetical protein
MVTSTDGRYDPRTRVAVRWYRQGMFPARTRVCLTAAACLLVTVVAAGCLPPPTAVTTVSASPETSSEPQNATPKPSATPKPQDLAIAAFAKLVAGGKLSYRVSFKGEVRMSVDRLPIAGAMDVSGKDFSTSFTYDFEPTYPGLGKYRVQVRGVDGRGWTKRGSGAWTQIKSYGPAQSYVPFKTVTAAADVKYLGPVKIGGSTFHKVLVKDALLIHPNTLPYQSQKERVDESEVEILIDNKGTPRSGTWMLRGQARIGPGDGQLQRVRYDLQLTFSKVGDKLSIKRP